MSAWNRLAGRTPFTLSEAQRFLVLSVFIGLFAGLLVTCFHMAIDLVSWATLGTPPGARWLATLLSPAVGGAAAGLLVMFLVPQAAGSGINTTKSAIYISDGYVPFRGVVGKFVACTLSIGSGNPLGPEDPSLMMGAGLASRLGRAFKLTRDHMRLIAPVGAAAGLAAAFNTPITAVLFVIEEVLAAWNAGVLGSIVLAAVSAVVVSRAFLGDAPLFQVPQFTLTHPSELLVYALIGIVGGLLGAGYIKVVTSGRVRLKAMPRKWRAVQPAVAGLIVGAAGLVAPGVMGAGYGTIDSALRDEFAWPILIGLGLLKAALTALCFGSGTPGGLFAPTLFVGATIGGGIGGLAHAYWPAATSPASAYVLVGMGTFFAAVFRTPMTSIFMVFEVSTTYVIILPVMVANTLSFLVSRALQGSGIFEMMGRLEGVVLPSVSEQRERPPRRVEEAVRPTPHVLVVGPATPLAEVQRLLEARPEATHVVARAGDMWRVAPRSRVPDAFGDEGPLSPADAAIAELDVAAVFPDEALETALRRLAAHPVLPVASRDASRRLIGVLTLDAALAAYGLTLHPGTPAPLNPRTTRNQVDPS